MAHHTVTAPPGFAYIYVIECVGRYKVGWSLDAWRRLETLQPGNVFRLRMALTRLVPKDKAREIECGIHARLARFRVSREWFKASFEQVQVAIENTLAQHRYERGRVVGQAQSDLDADDEGKTAWEIETGGSTFCRPNDTKNMYRR